MTPYSKDDLTNAVRPFITLDNARRGVAVWQGVVFKDDGTPWKQYFVVAAYNQGGGFAVHNWCSGGIAGPGQSESYVYADPVTVCTNKIREKMHARYVTVLSEFLGPDQMNSAIPNWENLSSFGWKAKETIHNLQSYVRNHSTLDQLLNKHDDEWEEKVRESFRKANYATTTG